MYDELLETTGTKQWLWSSSLTAQWNWALEAQLVSSIAGKEQIRAKKRELISSGVQ